MLDLLSEIFFVTILVIVCPFILGSILRRLQGGVSNVFGLHRYQVVIAYFALCIGVWIKYAFYIEEGLTILSFLICIIITLCWYGDMLAKQVNFSNPLVVWRYGIAPFIVAIITQWWPAAITGIVLGVASHPASIEIS